MDGQEAEFESEQDSDPGFARSIQEQMWNMLADGLPHSRNDLHALCGPSSPSVVAVHIHSLKKRLIRGEEIVCVLINRQTHYRRVRTLGSANNGRS